MTIERFVTMAGLKRKTHVSSICWYLSGDWWSGALVMDSRVAMDGDAASFIFIIQKVFKLCSCNASKEKTKS